MRDSSTLPGFQVARSVPPPCSSQTWMSSQLPDAACSGRHDIERPDDDVTVGLQQQCVRLDTSCRLAARRLSSIAAGRARRSLGRAAMDGASPEALPVLAPRRAHRRAWVIAPWSGGWVVCLTRMSRRRETLPAARSRQTSSFYHGTDPLRGCSCSGCLGRGGASRRRGWFDPPASGVTKPYGFVVPGRARLPTTTTLPGPCV